MAEPLHDQVMQKIGDAAGNRQRRKGDGSGFDDNGRKGNLGL
jgi:hypothetical protein